jgi:hypothetical protein
LEGKRGSSRIPAGASSGLFVTIEGLSGAAGEVGEVVVEVEESVVRAEAFLSQVSLGIRVTISPKRSLSLHKASQQGWDNLHCLQAQTQQEEQQQEEELVIGQYLPLILIAEWVTGSMDVPEPEGLQALKAAARAACSSLEKPGDPKGHFSAIVTDSSAGIV